MEGSDIYRLMVPSALKDAKRTIDSQITGEFREADVVKQLVKEGLKQSYLEVLLLPLYSDISEDGVDKLLVSARCDSSPETHHYVSTKIAYVATSGCKNMISRQRDPKNYIEARVALDPEGTNTIFTARNHITGKEIFRIEYYKKHQGDFGSLKFIFDSELAERDLSLPSRMYSYIWRSVVANGKRLRAFGNKGEANGEAEALGLKIYKGNLKIEDIGGYEPIKEKIDRDIFLPFLRRDSLDKIIAKTRKPGFEPILKPVLFYGPSGTGKTLMARGIAGNDGMDMIYFSLSDMFTKWYGESAKKLTEVLNFTEKYAREHGNTVLFIDEIDSLGKREGDTGADVENIRVINNFLTRIDGMMNNKRSRNILIIGATNNYSALDAALLSRFSSKIYFPLPSKEDRKKILGIYMMQLDAADIERLADRTDGFTGRDIETLAGMAERGFDKDVEKGKASGVAPSLDYYLNTVGDILKKKSDSTPSAGIYR